MGLRCPSAGAPEWAYLSNLPDSPTTIPAHAQTAITFSEYWTTDTGGAVFVFTPPPSGSGQRLGALVPGLYLYSFHAVTESTTVTKDLAMDFTGTLPERWNEQATFAPNNWNTSIAPNGTSPWQHTQIAQTYLGPSDFPFDYYVQITAINLEAFDVDLDGVFLTVAYWPASKNMVQLV